MTEVDVVLGLRVDARARLERLGVRTVGVRPNIRMLRLSGHSAAYYEYQAPHLEVEYRLSASPRSGTDAGVVFGAVTFYPARGLPDKTPADTIRVAKLELVIADIVSRFVS